MNTNCTVTSNCYHPCYHMRFGTLPSPSMTMSSFLSRFLFKVLRQSHNTNRECLTLRRSRDREGRGNHRHSRVILHIRFDKESSQLWISFCFYFTWIWWKSLQQIESEAQQHCTQRGLTLLGDWRFSSFYRLDLLPLNRRNWWKTSAQKTLYHSCISALNLHGSCQSRIFPRK